jgi:hypothetical protein
MNLLAIIAIPITLLLFGLCFMNSPRRLSKSEKESIQKHGIMHYTSQLSANQIKDTAHVKASTKHRRSYFFVNDCDVSKDILKHNRVLEKDCKLVIFNISADQMKKFRKRRDDFALEYKGNFVINTSNQLCIQEANIQHNPPTSRRFRVYQKAYRFCAWSLFPLAFAVIFVDIIQKFL